MQINHHGSYMERFSLSDLNKSLKIFFWNSAMRTFSIMMEASVEVKNATLDTPFQKTLYIWDIGTSGKTVSGEPIVENLILPEIRLLDLIQDIRFCLGCATSAHISFRNGDLKTASNLFYRSCLY